MSFADFDLHPTLKKGIEAQGFTKPTPVQEATIPLVINHRDVRACAQTGTGKTCAFVLPILHNLLQLEHRKKPNTLIIVPTRELGTQVHQVIKEVGQFTGIKSVLIMGGTDFTNQVNKIRTGAEIIVATPGRLLDHMKRRTFSLDAVQALVMDEADRMLDMGFLPDIKHILTLCPKNRQTMLFSATYPDEIKGLVSHFLKDPAIVDIQPDTPHQNIQQILYPISRSQKEKFLFALLKTGLFPSALIFSRTKHGADHLAKLLIKDGKKVGVIHSNLSQNQREAALSGFKSKEFQILVATDIAARGIDVKDISHVINYDVPHNAEDYVHRIGRTGRAEATGDAVTLMAPDEEVYMNRIEKLIGKDVRREALEGFPYLVQPRMSKKVMPLSSKFGRMRSKIASSANRRFKR